MSTAPSPLVLYVHPLSATCRPVLMFAADHGLALECRVIDLFAAEQAGPMAPAANPHQTVPLLVDGDTQVHGLPAVLEHLAARVGPAAYPPSAGERRRVDEAMDWFEHGLAQDLVLALADPVTRRSPPRLTQQLAILDEWMVGPNHSYLLGEQISLADYLGLGVLTLADTLGLGGACGPNIRRWLAVMRARPSFAATADGEATAAPAGQACMTVATV